MGNLGLSEGDHWVKFHVRGDEVSFEVSASVPAGKNEEAEKHRNALQFIQKWSGKGSVINVAETRDDPRLAALTEKHLH